MNKQTCKIKRNVSLLMLKANQYEEALNELLEVEVCKYFLILLKELEKNLYGEDSVQLGKTYKIIGTLNIITEKAEEAKQYLQMAYKIFENKGQDKLMKEVSSKIKLLNASKKGEGKLNEDENELQSYAKDSSASPAKL